MKRNGSSVGLAALVACLALSAILRPTLAAEPVELRACLDCPAALPPPVSSPILPPVVEIPVPAGLELLQLDDGSCEAGLGTSTVLTMFQSFEVPPGQLSSGEILAVTARINTLTATGFAFAQPGFPPPGSGDFDSRVIQLLAEGPCPASKLRRALLPEPHPVFTGSPFWAGIIGPAFVGRDTDTPGNVWLNCANCSMSQYTPTDLTNFGLGGTWMIRLLVELPNLIPVELQSYSIDD